MLNSCPRGGAVAERIPPEGRAFERKRACSVKISYTKVATICSLYVHYMFTICSLYNHYMFTICSLYAQKFTFVGVMPVSF